MTQSNHDIYNSVRIWKARQTVELHLFISRDSPVHGCVHACAVCIRERRKLDCSLQLCKHKHAPCHVIAIHSADRQLVVGQRVITEFASLYSFLYGGHNSSDARVLADFVQDLPVLALSSIQGAQLEESRTEEELGRGLIAAPGWEVPRSE